MKHRAAFPLILVFMGGLLRLIFWPHSQKNSHPVSPAPAAQGTTPELDTQPDPQPPEQSPAGTDAATAARGFTNRCIKLFENHYLLISLAMTGLTAVLVVMKALIAADGELDTASILLTGGISQIALSSIVAALPFAALGGTLAASATLGQAWREGVLTRTPFLVLAVTAAFTFATTSWYFAPMAFFLGITGGLLFSSKNPDKKLNEYGLLGCLILATTGVLTGLFYGQVAALSTMWLPAESLTIQSAPADPAAPAEAPEQLVGYVIGQDGYYLTVLEENTRVVTFVETSSVLERERCRVAPQQWSELPLPWGGAADKYDLC